jgi:hypothetical protein
MKKKSRLLLSILFFLLSIMLSACESGIQAVDAAAGTYSLSQLQEDFMQLRRVIEGKHPNLYHSEEELRKVFDEQFKLLKDGMSELEFYRVLSPILPTLGCGHTNIYVSKNYDEYLKQNGRYIPLSVKYVGEQLLVSENLSEADIPVGSEIVFINGRSIPDIIKLLYANLPADGYNLTKKQYIVNNWFNAVYYYFVENPEAFAVEYRKPGEEQLLKVIIPAVANSGMHMTTMDIHFKEIDGEVYFGEVKDNYARLVIKSFQTSRFKSGDYKKYIDSFFLELKKKETPNLIIDLRGNWGGSANLAAHLFTYLIKEPTPYFEKAMFLFGGLKKPLKPAENSYNGKVFVLADGASFSTSGHLASLIKYHGLGTFIGEESGGGAVVTDGGKSITLKNTKIRAYCATTVFKTAVEGLPEGRGVIPDLVVRPSLEDYLKGNDPQLKKTLELINGVM